MPEGSTTSTALAMPVAMAMAARISPLTAEAPPRSISAEKRVSRPRYSMMVAGMKCSASAMRPMTRPSTSARVSPPSVTASTASADICSRQVPTPARSLSRRGANSASPVMAAVLLNPMSASCSVPRCSLGALPKQDKGQVRQLPVQPRHPGGGSSRPALGGEKGLHLRPVAGTAMLRAPAAVQLIDVVEQARLVVGVHRLILCLFRLRGGLGNAGARMIEPAGLAVVQQHQARLAIDQPARPVGHAGGNTVPMGFGQASFPLARQLVLPGFQPLLGHDPGGKEMPGPTQPEGGGMGRGVLVGMLPVVGHVGVGAVAVLPGSPLGQGMVGGVDRQVGKFHQPVLVDGPAQLLQKGIGRGVVGIALPQGLRHPDAQPQGSAVQLAMAALHFAFTDQVVEGEGLSLHGEVRLALTILTM